jgi:hypothetical protein
VAALWGVEALDRFEFPAVPQPADGSKISMLLQPFRHT